MGKINYFTKTQELIFSSLAQDTFFQSQFYFTGGTALSVVYLHHRESDDLDFFSEKPFDNQTVFDKITALSKKHSFTFELKQTENIYFYQLYFANKEELKVDFLYYLYKHIKETETFQNFSVDSLSDIATNKLLTIIQRTQVKDFVDLYFLLQHFTIWDLMEGLKIKFNLETEPFLLAHDFLKVEQFTFLPKMILPLTLEELNKFFTEKAKELAKMSAQ